MGTTNASYSPKPICEKDFWKRVFTDFFNKFKTPVIVGSIIFAICIIALLIQTNYSY